jgi:outer membrane protein assembly factor BamB
MKKILLVCIALAAVVTVLGVGACSKKDKKIDPPAELVDFVPKLNVQKLWSASLGGGDKRLRVGLAPVADGGKVFAASHDGDVVALDVASGRNHWRIKTKRPLSAGPGVGAGVVVVGSEKGDVIALSEDSGAELWRIKVGGELLSAPAVSEKAVVVRTVDGRLRGLAPSDGHELWAVDQVVPRLSLRGTAPPVLVGDTVICGFDNGKVVAVNVLTGDVLWENAVAPAKGRTELERLVDIDSAVEIADQDVFVVGFQGRAAMLALESGQIWWARDASSYRGLALDPNALYIADADGAVLAMRRKDGSELWRQDLLHRRALSAPVIDGDAVVVADFEGYVHWIDRSDGAIIGRAQSGGERVMKPIVVNGVVLVQSDSGSLTAFRSRPLSGKAGAASG